MAKHGITVELDDETVRCLAELGAPRDVLARLADAAADGVRRPGQPRRVETDASLRIERDKADAREVAGRDVVEAAADRAVETARARADDRFQSARDAAAREHGRYATAADADADRLSARADVVLEHERSAEDSLRERERGTLHRDLADAVALERGATDKNLTGERAHVDELIVDQRDANAQMVRLTLRAQELTDEAEAARARAEQSARELRAVAEFRELFIGILGHDLRNPLGSILMSTESLLRGGRLDPDAVDAAGRIARSGQRMNRMITQLLDLTRARLGGGLPIEPAPVDLRSVCRDVVGEFGATVRLEVEGDVTGTWDADRIAEVLSNLTSNARDYAAPGTPVIVAARAAGADVIVEVRNQGVAISADVLPQLFEPFRRAQSHEKSTAGNLGLGLYISDQIVRAHGGTLDAHSTAGTTTFAMRLPRRAASLRP